VTHCHQWSRPQLRVMLLSGNDLRHVVCINVPVSKQYKSVAAKGQRCLMTGKVTASLTSHCLWITGFSTSSTYGLKA